MEYYNNYIYAGKIYGSMFFDSRLLKSSPYDQVYELGKTAIEKFGKDPSVFRETLDEYKPRSFVRKIREMAKETPSSWLRFNSSYVREYINCLTAILQVDLECPGFIDNFPEAINYLKVINEGELRRIVYGFEKLYDKSIDGFNRYSGISDIKYVKDLFEIPDKKEKRRYDEHEIRFDDDISINFLRFWNNRSNEQEDYLRKYYIYPETLLPEDYRDLVYCSNIFNNPENVKLEKGDLGWVDIYFEHLDEIRKEVYSNIYNLSPSLLRKINLTLT